MTPLFPGYYELTRGELQKLWKECVFVLDANVLLNLYKYSRETRATFLNVFELIKTRLWLPHQAAQEFFKNRLSVILRLERSYKDIKKKLSSLKSEVQKELKNLSPHPLIDTDKVSRKLDKFILELNGDLTAMRKKHPKFRTKDSLQSKILKILGKNVGAPYTRERLQEIYEIGETRYNLGVPPGYEEKKNDVRKYGDLIIWFQILEYARDENKPIIFITDDRKADWWHKHGDSSLSPRPELIDEMLTEAGAQFYMYTSTGFIDNAETYLTYKTAEKAKEEVKAVAERDKLAEDTREIIRQTDDDLESLIRRIEKVIAGQPAPPLRFTPSNVIKREPPPEGPVSASTL